ncbi:MAG: hypothetical protein COX92_00395 [Candidatus Nealsonbacteria bacterium CG_4_10_14_0_2_um_filter_40_15]|uniref:Small ribosomal subunit protein bS20 n=2 Tax=Candidatus Nealsoniibacteriota TaxID=1817911 RepID=A0A2M7D7P9_9BACT|nr:MAG: hypothetical protein COS26_02070 [Candidatus Nealsonbacteria bacterium CG02_land_8_20_14_3_00_40_11]PIZ87803.1 MAG: hypothetical protein COX92_00395 [Candidatus Nealsonbacteria bacterium CG_4_10_14_0_2_um_filter_40_15]
MPITKAAKKSLRQSLRRRTRNVQKKRKIKSLLKEVRNLITRAQAKREDEQSSSPYQKKVKEDKSSFPPSLSRGESSAINEVKKLLPQVYKLLDKAGKTGLIKKNTASRTKSRITRSINRA